MRFDTAIEVVNRAALLLKGIDPKMILPDYSPHTITIVVPQRELNRTLELLHGEFFQESSNGLFREHDLASK